MRGDVAVVVCIGGGSRKEVLGREFDGNDCKPSVGASSLAVGGDCHVTSGSFRSLPGGCVACLPSTGVCGRALASTSLVSNRKDSDDNCVPSGSSSDNAGVGGCHDVCPVGGPFPRVTGSALCLRARVLLLARHGS